MNLLRVLCVIFFGLAATAQTPKTAMTYINPVYNSDFPDPFVMRVGSSYYAYATNGGGATVQILQSSDLVNWQALSDAFGNLPAWATPGWTWAPEVEPVPNGYAMYYTTRHSDSQKQCIGVAFSKSPLVTKLAAEANNGADKSAARVSLRRFISTSLMG